MIMDVDERPEAQWVRGAGDRLFEVAEFSDWLVLDLPDEDEPGNFRAIAADETRFVGDPDIRRGHAFREPHWFWITSDPSRYPPLPFLLTDNPAHRLVYHGRADLQFTKRTLGDIEERFRTSGKFHCPVAGDGWFGMVRLRAPHASHGRCWCYADSDVQIAGRHDEIRWGDSPIGSIIFPTG